jgi:hypothetical protein
MNNKGSVLIYGMMLGLVVIVLALALAPSVAQFTNGARNDTSYSNVTYELSNGTLVNGTVEATGMNCSSSSISDFQKAACYVTDLNLFYFIAGLIFIGGAIVTARLLFP